MLIATCWTPCKSHSSLASRDKNSLFDPPYTWWTNTLIIKSTMMKYENATNNTVNTMIKQTQWYNKINCTISTMNHPMQSQNWGNIEQYLTKAMRMKHINNVMMIKDEQFLIVYFSLIIQLNPAILDPRVTETR